MRVLIADDQADFRSGLRDLLSSVEGVQVVGEAVDGKSAVYEALRLDPDITLMDVRMPVMDGITATAAIRAARPGACILVLTTFDEDQLVKDAMQAGAAGYLLKGTSVDDISLICDLALRGYTTMSPRAWTLPTIARANDEIQKAVRSASRLSDREKEVWALIGEGATNREIALRLALGEGTVKNYVTSLLASLGVRHRTAAALLWRALNL